MYATITVSTPIEILANPARVDRELRIQCPDIPENMRSLIAESMRNRINLKMTSLGMIFFSVARKLLSEDLILVAESTTSKIRAERNKA